MTEEHTHHWVPRRTGKYTSTREAVQEMKCDCGMTLTEWAKQEADKAPPLSDATKARLARLLRGD